MGHSSATMTARHTGEIPMQQVRSAFTSLKNQLLETMETEQAA